MSIRHCLNMSPASDTFRVIRGAPRAVQAWNVRKHSLPCLREFDGANAWMGTLRGEKMSSLRCVIKTGTALRISWAGPRVLISCWCADRSPLQTGQEHGLLLGVCLLWLTLGGGSHRLEESEKQAFRIYTHNILFQYLPTLCRHHF